MSNSLPIGKTSGLDPELSRIAERLLTAEQTAEMLHVSVHTLAKWRLKNPENLPFVRLGPYTPGKRYCGRIAYRLSTVLQRMEAETGSLDRNDLHAGMQRRSAR